MNVNQENVKFGKSPKYHNPYNETVLSRSRVKPCDIAHYAHYSDYKPVAATGKFWLMGLLMVAGAIAYALVQVM